MALDPNTTPNSDSLQSDLIDSSEVDLIEIEQEIAQLSEFVTSNPTLLGGEDVAELLQRLTNAENMAEGMENKIDNVLQNLDDLLGYLDNVCADESANVVEQDDVVEATSSSGHQNDNQTRADSSLSS